jgi:hypothetical protein
VTDFQVEFVLALICAHDDSIVGLIVGSIVHSIQGSIVGSVGSTLGSELFLYLRLPFLGVDDGSAVVGNMVYIPLVSFPARVQEDGEVI